MILWGILIEDCAEILFLDFHVYEITEEPFILDKMTTQDTIANTLFAYITTPEIGIPHSIMSSAPMVSGLYVEVQL